MYICNSGICSTAKSNNSRDAPPWGSVDLGNTGMLNSQPYAAFVELELPRTKNNLEIGMRFLSKVANSR
jgi:hypothetical protein